MVSPSKKKKPRQSVKENEKKWTKEVVKAGWTTIPSVILDRQQAFGLTHLDVNIILQLARYWWTADNPPFPSKRALAECIGVSQCTIQRSIARMEKDGFLKREKRFDPNNGGQKSNIYRLDGLIEAAVPYAKEHNEIHNERKVEDAKRRTKKNLRVK